MKKTKRSIWAIFLSICLFACDIYSAPIVRGEETLTNVANGRNNYTYMTSNANKMREGFCYIGNGFDTINSCNESLTNGNNLLGQTATTEEVAIYVDLGANYDISKALIYQGSTNSNYYDSYCTNYSIYYSAEQVSPDSEGNISWSLAGSCDYGTIYSGAKVKNAANVSDSGDSILFTDTYTARSIKVVFDKESCMGTGVNGEGTGTIGTTSLLSVRIYGVTHQEETTTTENEITTKEETTTKQEETTEATEQDDTLYASFTDDLALKSNHSAVKGYASSNLRSGATSPLTVNNLTNGSVTGTNYIIANTTAGDTTPWFAVDLGEVYDLNKVTVTPGASESTYPNAYPISYQIQVASETNNISQASDICTLTWETVATVTDGTLKVKSVIFPRENARYVRIFVESYADYCSLYELSIYETDDSLLLGEEENIMNVLFVGNSMTYYNTLCKVVEGFAKLQGKSIQCTESTAGGRNLVYHTNYSQTLSAIQSGAYDVVVLQDIVGSFDGDNLMSAATTLSNMILEYNPNAKIVLYMPWPVKGSLTGDTSLLPYFTYNYIKAARSNGALLAPAGEAFYTLYNTYEEMEWYCADEKHPTPIGTFVSATSVYYAMFPDAEKVKIDETNVSAVNQIINNNIAYSGYAVTQYDAELLNNISNYGYYYSHQVNDAVSDATGKTKYVSVAGDYTDADDEIDKTGLTEVQGETVSSSLFSKENGNIAVGCKAYASNERQAASNATDGNTGTRWETDFEDPQWLYVDLGEVKNIGKVGFIWEGAYASKYYIQISNDAQEWTTVSMITATAAKTVQISLDKTYSCRYVRMMGTRRGTSYGYSFYEMGIWEGEVLDLCNISVDGVSRQVEQGSTYILPQTATYGYYANGKMYQAGASVKVLSDMDFTSVNTMSVTVEQGAAIRTEFGTSNHIGLRFKATVTTDNDTALGEQTAISTGMLITANDIYATNGELTIDSTYAKLNVVNSGWYGDEIGVYCGSISNISQYNYVRSFIARAYVTINYEDGTKVTIYSGMTGKRSARYVAKAVQTDSEAYEALTETQKTVIDTVAVAQ